jgi:hypothetical protein
MSPPDIMLVENRRLTPRTRPVQDDSPGDGLFLPTYYP